MPSMRPPWSAIRKRQDTSGISGDVSHSADPPRRPDSRSDQKQKHWHKDGQANTPHLDSIVPKCRKSFELHAGPAPLRPRRFPGHQPRLMQVQCRQPRKVHEFGFWGLPEKAKSDRRPAEPAPHCTWEPRGTSRLVAQQRSLFPLAPWVGGLPTSPSPLTDRPLGARPAPP